MKEMLEILKIKATLNRPVLSHYFIFKLVQFANLYDDILSDK